MTVEIPVGSREAKGTAPRARIMVDLLLLAAASGAAWLIARPLLLASAFHALAVAGALFAGLLVVVLASCAVLGRARRAAPRSDAFALSTFRWGGVAAALLITAAYVSWLTHPAPAALENAYAVQGGSGEWMIVAGKARHRFDFEPLLLMKTDRSEMRRLPIARSGFASDTVASHDGHWLAVAERGAFDARRRIVMYDLLRMSARPRKTDIVLPPMARYALSDDGSMLAVWQQGMVAVSDVGGSRVVASTRIPIDSGESRAAMLFRDGAVRIYVTRRDQKVMLYELTLPGGSLRTLGTIAVEASGAQLSTNEDGSRILVRTFNGAAVIYDHAGVELVRFTPAAGDRIVDARFLEEDRVALSVRSGSGTTILVRALSTRRSSVTKLDDKRAISIRGEVAPGLLLIEAADPAAARRGELTVSLLDLTRGGTLRKEALRTAHQISEGATNIDPRMPVRIRDRIVFSPDGSMLRWDPITGEKHVVIAP